MSSRCLAVAVRPMQSDQAFESKLTRVPIESNLVRMPPWILSRMHELDFPWHFQIARDHALSSSRSVAHSLWVMVQLPFSFLVAE